MAHDAPSPFALRPLPHLLASASALALLGVLDGAVAPTLGQGALCRRDAAGACDRRRLLRLDRAALGTASARWKKASDALQLVTIASALLATATQAALAAPPGTGWAAATCDVAVGVEAAAVGAVATTLLKYAVRRPRPGAFRGAVGDGVGQQLSFPSGHTSAAFASGAAWATTAWLRPLPLAVRWSVGGAALGLGALVGCGRVLGGQHFVTDVLAGALLGAAVGVAVPLSYRGGAKQPVRLVPTASPALGPGGALRPGLRLTAAF